MNFQEGHPQVKRMASGNLSLEISDSVSWDEFPEAAHAFLKFARGFTLFKADTGAERCWLVLVGFRPFFLAQDEMGMSLDSITRFGGSVIANLQEQLSSASGHRA